VRDFPGPALLGSRPRGGYEPVSRRRSTPGLPFRRRDRVSAESRSPAVEATERRVPHDGQPAPAAPDTHARARSPRSHTAV